MSESRPSYDDPERYAELAGFKGSWRDLWWNEDFLELTARRLELGSVRRMLDVGTGAGHWGLRLLPHLSPDATMAGVDVHESFGELVAEQAREKGLSERVRFVHGDGLELPFEDDSFDLATCQTVMIHVGDVPALLAEMRRVVRPGGLILAAEPDNRAGNMTLVNGHPECDDEDLFAIFRFMLQRDRGKMALGEGDDSIGAKLPGLFQRAGLMDLRTWTNDRCNTLLPPYADPVTKLLVDTELEWAKEDISMLCGSQEDSRRLALAGGATEAQVAEGFAAMLRWLRAFEAGVADKQYDAARGYVMYLCAGRVPDV